MIGGDKMQKIAIIGAFSTETDTLVLNEVRRYGAEVMVCHPKSSDSADDFGAVFYISDSNPQTDEEVLSKWVGHSHLRVVNSGNLSRLCDEVLAFLGLPQPIETERKLLIKMPDLDFLDKSKLCAAVEISQTYIIMPDSTRARIRKRMLNGNAVYIKTVKHRVSALTRIEIETRLTEDEYNHLMQYADKSRRTIEKVRRCIIWGGKYYELDVYPFWKNQATLEIELLSEDEEFDIPPFLEVMRDVTADKAYSNSSLAKHIPKE